MKKYRLVIVGALIIIGISVLGYKTLFSLDMTHLNGKGTLLSTHPSPDKSIIAKTYEIKGNATVANQLRVGITSEKDGLVDETVYWQYRDYKDDLRWVDEHRFIIDQQTIDIQDKSTWYNFKAHE